MKRDLGQTYCPLLWSNLEINPNGDVYPCCEMYEHEPWGNLNQLNVDQILSSEKVKTMRELSQNNSPIKECNECYHREKMGAESARQIAIDQYGEIQDTRIRRLGLRFSNRCNITCQMCSPLFSSQWAAKVGNGVAKVVEVRTEVIPELLELASGADEIYFAGGEPLLERRHFNVLDYLIERGETDKLLDYNTNLVSIDLGRDHFLNKIKHFKRVDLGVSVDGLGDKYEQIRQGSSWHQLERNIELARKLPNVSIGIDMTVQEGNVLDLPEMIQHFLEQWEVLPFSIRFRILRTPEKFSILGLDWKRREELRRKYSAFVKDYLFPKLSLNAFSYLSRELKAVENELQDN